MEILRANGIRCACLLPLTTAQRRLGTLGFGPFEAEAYSEADLEFMGHAARRVAVAVDNALNYQIAELTRKLEEERSSLGDGLCAAGPLARYVQG